MKTLHLFLLGVFFLFQYLHVQAIDSISGDSTALPKTLFETISKIKKQGKLPTISLNTRIAFHSSFTPTGEEQSFFRLDYLRLQASGDITDRIYYKWMQHLNRSNSPRKLDNTPSSIDCLGLGFRITPTLSTFIGKQYADYGGFEYDASPAEVYQYSDFGEYITCFLVGVNFAWQFTPTQEIRFQVVDGRSNTAEEAFGKTPETFSAAKAPLGYTVNWNGSFLSNQLLTRCSFSAFHEGQKENVYFLALAAAWIQENFNMYIDGMYSAEDIDKLGIISELIPQTEHTVRSTHTKYFSLVSRINYRLMPKLNIFVKGMYETSGFRKDQPDIAKGLFRTSYGYQGGVEYFPMKENLRFFAMYRGRSINYTQQAKELGLTNQQFQYLSLGLIYNIPIF